LEIGPGELGFAKFAKDGEEEAVVVFAPKIADRAAEKVGLDVFKHAVEFVFVGFAAQDAENEGDNGADFEGSKESGEAT
jgi:hypothetical protein